MCDRNQTMNSFILNVRYCGQPICSLVTHRVPLKHGLYLNAKSLYNIIVEPPIQILIKRV